MNPTYAFLIGILFGTILGAVVALYIVYVALERGVADEHPPPGETPPAPLKQVPSYSGKQCQRCGEPAVRTFDVKGREQYYCHGCTPHEGKY